MRSWIVPCFGNDILGVIPGLGAAENPGSITAEVSGKIDERSASSGIVSGYGSRVPLRGPGMTRRVIAPWRVRRSAAQIGRGSLQLSMALSALARAESLK